jgi:hypothetical protein
MSQVAVGDIKASLKEVVDRENFISVLKVKMRR